MSCTSGASSSSIQPRRPIDEPTRTVCDAATQRGGWASPDRIVDTLRPRDVRPLSGGEVPGPKVASGSSIDSRPAEISAENLSSDVAMPFSRPSPPTLPAIMKRSQLWSARADLPGTALAATDHPRLLRLSMSGLGLHSRTLRQVVHIALVAACTALGAQERPTQAPQQVTITGTSRQDVEKSYRKMVQGLDYFERARAAVAPDASLRFKLLPRKPGTDMDHIVLEVIGSAFSYAVPIAPDHTFVLGARRQGHGGGRRRFDQSQAAQHDMAHRDPYTRTAPPHPAAR